MGLGEGVGGGDGGRDDDGGRTSPVTYFQTLLKVCDVFSSLEILLCDSCLSLSLINWFVVLRLVRLLS